tara:strand:- start:1343 stop:1747 length:405 start_codon:yes stop_codon:yes gene_type:complete
MAKKIRITEADVRRMVLKVINEQDCGGGDKGGMGSFADLGGMGMGFDNPIESRYGELMDDEEIMLDEQGDLEDDTEDDVDDDLEGSNTTSISGSGKFSDKDVMEVKLFNDGKKNFSQLTVNQKTLAKLLSYTKK